MANFYRIGAAELNWKNTGSWSSTSGGASNGIDEPTLSDDVFFDANSPVTVTVTTAASANTLSLTKASLVITLNGGSLVISGATSIATNAATINKTAAETFSTNAGSFLAVLSGTAKMIFTGGTWSGATSVAISVDLDLQGTITVSGNVGYATGILTHVSGTITVTSSTLNLRATCTLNTSGMSWDNVTASINAQTYTLTSNLIINGLFTVGATTTFNKTTSETITVALGLTSSGSIIGTAEIILTGGTWSGAGTITSNLTFQGATGTYTFTVTSANATAGATYTNNGQTFTVVTTIAAGTTLVCTGTGAPSSSGTLTKSTGTGDATITHSAFTNIVVSGSVTYGGTSGTAGTLKYTSGTITTTSSTLTITAGIIPVLNTNGITWNNITIGSGSGTVTLTSNLSCSGLLNITGQTTLNKTTSETVTTSGGLGSGVNGQISGTAKIILTGGTWSGSNTVGLSSSLDLQGTITVSGTVYYRSGTLTYVSGTITVAGSTLLLTASCILNTNGMQWNALSLNADLTLTLSSDARFNGLVSSTTNNEYTLAGAGHLNCHGGISLVINGSINGGTVNLKGGTWSSSAASGQIRSGILNINGNCTISGIVYVGGQTVNYLSGTATVVGSTLNTGIGSTLNTAGMSWNNVVVGTTTLTANCYLNGVLSIPTSATLAGAYTYYANGLTMGAITTSGSGSTVELVGGVWSSGGGSFVGNLWINGNVTVSGNVYFGSTGYTLTYVSGAVITTGSTLNLNSCIVNTAGMTWNNVALVSGSTITMDSILSCATMSLTGNHTFAGTAGFTCNTLSHNGTSAFTVTYNAGLPVYRVTTAMNCNSSRVGSILVFTSSSGSRAKLTLDYGATCAVIANFTRMDASGGRPIRGFNSVVTDCINVEEIHDLLTVKA